MSAIGPGDWVECVNDGGMPEIVSVGAIYLVEGVGPAPISHVPCLVLRGVRHPTAPENIGKWVAAEYFRPIYRPSSDLIQSLLQPVDEPAEADRVDA